MKNFLLVTILFFSSFAYAGGSNPTAAFSWACEQMSCSFNGYASQPHGNRTIESYEWTFEDVDGPYHMSPNPAGVEAWEYIVDGTYEVSLTVTDNRGKTDSITKTIFVGDVPVVNITLHVIPDRNRNYIIWQGSTGAVIVYRDDEVIYTGENTGMISDNRRGQSTIFYQVCQITNGIGCSNPVVR